MIIDYYFATMTFLYVVTLFFAIFRANVLSYGLTFAFLILSNYIFIARNRGLMKRVHFMVVQEITKYILFFTICFLIKLVIFNSSGCVKCENTE